MSKTANKKIVRCSKYYYYVINETETEFEGIRLTAKLKRDKRYLNMTMKIPKNHCPFNRYCPCAVIKENVLLEDIRIKEKKKDDT